jgi:DNA polymerase-3 subunit epsilon
MLALYDAFPIRQCTTRLSPRRASSSCALGEMGRCCAPCELAVTPAQYAELTERVRGCLTSDVSPLVRRAEPRLRQLVRAERFEDAAVLTERLEGFSRAALRHHRLASLAGCSQIVAARRTDPGWEIHVIRHGRLAAAALARPGEVPQQVARDAVTVAEWVAPPPGPAPAAIIEETERIADWLEQPGVRLIEVQGDWCWPLRIGPAASVQIRIGA